MVGENQDVFKQNKFNSKEKKIEPLINPHFIKKSESRTLFAGRKCVVICLFRQENFWL